MKDENIYFFKQLLTEQLETLLGQADIVVHDLVEKENETSPDLVDRASFESERGICFESGTEKASSSGKSKDLSKIWKTAVSESVRCVKMRFQLSASRPDRLRPIVLFAKLKWRRWEDEIISFKVKDTIRIVNTHKSEKTKKHQS